MASSTLLMLGTSIPIANATVETTTLTAQSTLVKDFNILFLLLVDVHTSQNGTTSAI